MMTSYRNNYHILTGAMGGTTDAERKMSFEAAHAFGVVARSIYAELGYQILEVPRVSPPERAQFIVDSITSQG